MRVQLPAFVCCLVASFAGPQPTALHAQNAGEIKIEKRSLKSPAGEAIKYEIGTLFVPENRSQPNSRVIGVGFARFPATAEIRRAPPVFHLPGGPGNSYLTGLETTSTSELERRFALASMQASCDVVFVDQ